MWHCEAVLIESVSCLHCSSSARGHVLSPCVHRGCYRKLSQQVRDEKETEETRLKDASAKLLDVLQRKLEQDTQAQETRLR